MDALVQPRQRTAKRFITTSAPGCANEVTSLLPNSQRPSLTDRPAQDILIHLHSQFSPLMMTTISASWKDQSTTKRMPILVSIGVWQPRPIWKPRRIGCRNRMESCPLLSAALSTLLLVFVVGVVMAADTIRSIPPLSSATKKQDLPTHELHHHHALFENLQSGFEHEAARFTHLVSEMTKHTTFAGTVKPLLKRFSLGSHEAAILWKSLQETIHWEDVILIAAVGWLTVPMLRLLYEAAMVTQRGQHSQQQTKHDGTPTYWYDAEGRPRRYKSNFRRSSIYLLADHLQQLSKIALAVYAVDILKMVCLGFGFEFCKMSAFPHAFAQSAYVTWISNRMCRFKQSLIRRYVAHHPETFGRMRIVNKFLTAAIAGLTVFVVLNTLQLEMGVAMHSILAFGSVGTLAVGLASQGVAKEILNGLMLASSDRIYEGDTVRFGNGISGKIEQLGWMETILRGSDEIMVSIPNSDLVSQRVSNLSRVRYSQVKQTLRVHYKDCDKLPALVQTIKDEIFMACPDVVTDGSRPFRAHWTDFGESALEVTVDAHFRVKPVGDDYWDNRQRVLQAIATAVKKHSISFALPP